MLNGVGPTILGAPKSLEELPVFVKAELTELFTGMTGLVQQGMPADLPAGIPLGQLVRMAATLQKYHAIVGNLALVDLDEHPDELPETIRGLKADAVALLNARHPTEIGASKSRVVLPS